MINLRRFILPAALAVLLGLTTITLFKFYVKEKPFYLRLKSRKKRQYRLRNIRSEESTVLADLSHNDSNFLFKLTFHNDEVIHVQISDPILPRYTVRDVILEPEIASTEDVSIQRRNTHVHIKYMSFEVTINCDDFGINAYKNNESFFCMNLRKALLVEEEEPHLGIAADFLFVDAIRAYGLPQHAEKMSLMCPRDKLYRLFNIDRFAYSTSRPHESLYGTVPLLYAYGTNQTTGLFWLNSSETYVDVEYGNNGLYSTFFSESGVLDFYVLSGPRLQDCVRQNSELTGAVPLPPLFALGYHQSRYSYMSQEEVIEVSNKFDENQLPLDSLWMDIDYTDSKKYFTWNPITFPNPPKLLEFLENEKRKAVVIIDPHIKVDENYFVYSQCKQNDFLVKNPNQTVFTAKCWPGVSSWIDFSNPIAREYYAEIHKDFVKSTNLHIWNDMNEPALFGTKENSMSKNAVHYGNWKHRDVHNLYGFYQTMATYEGLLKRTNLRPFILTRSYFAGAQRYAAIWTGDNVASWEHLKISVPMCITASLTGFSLCGADIGGFVKHPDDELLQRWYQLGAWLPFFRGHSNCNVPRREPYLYDRTIQKRIRNALQQRYKHLLHWYTLFWQHCATLEPVIKPLIYQYPQNQDVLDLDDQFLVGENILVCPVTEAKTEHIDVYFPGGANEMWYYVGDSEIQQYKGVGTFTIPVDMDTTPVFYRGGGIIPIVENPVKSSAYVKDCPITLYIFCDQSGNSTGSLYYDDTESFDYLKKAYSYIRFDLEDSKISNVQINPSSSYNRPIILSSINLYGYERDVQNVGLTLQDVDQVDHKIATVKENDFIQISGINIDIQRSFVITLSGE